jgi:hypothetical protein
VIKRKSRPAGDEVSVMYVVSVILLILVASAATSVGVFGVWWLLTKVTGTY